MYRLGIEAILGVRRTGEALELDPRISSEWEGFEVRYRCGEASYRIKVENLDRVEQGVQRVFLDGTELPRRSAPERNVLLQDDGREHEVRVVMGSGRR